MKSFLWACETLKPDVTVMLGDVLDGATVSRFGRDDWGRRPSLAEELAACRVWLDAIRAAAPDAERIWVRGNHDQRLEKIIANKMPELEGVRMTRLADHFPDWVHCWRVELPGTELKHRWHAGADSARKNALKSGLNYFCGHDHALQVTRVTDRNGTRWGGSTGTLADVDGPQFAYSEHAPKDHCSGWILLTFENGRLLPPEMGVVTGPSEFSFRGQLFHVERALH
jgi:hypothetical protein